jgi:hypothetical protein
MIRNPTFLIIVSLAVLMTPMTANAQNLAIAGGQASRSADYAFAGVIHPIFDGQLGNGLFLAPIIGVSRYTFNQNEIRLTGTQPAVSLGIGYSTKLGPASASLSVAGGYANTTISPYVPNGSVHGGEFFVEPQVWLRVPVGKYTSVTANGGYLTGLRSYWFVGYAAYSLTPRLAIGPELDLGGGPNYRNRMLGVRFKIQASPRIGVAFTLGAITNIPGSYRPFVGINFVLPFH